jgi:hypothetical protein
VALDAAEKQKALTARKRGILSDQLSNMRERVLTSQYYSKERFEAILSEFILAFRNSCIIDLPERIDPPQVDEYVPGSLISQGSKRRLLESLDRSDFGRFTYGPYGQVISAGGEGLGSVNKS